ncbi:MAG TPA: ATP-binding cassette domain-containing protein [Pseudobdellovibrionaceae bacterium]|jgi:phospholipid/cholesterol/gamma-HCH transport system ATP-binding protein
MSLKLQGIEVSFDSQTILKNVSVEIPAGEVFVLMGPSGHGKTTLLKTMAGLITPRNGKVFINQQDWSTLGDNERFETLKKLGMLFQKNALFDSLTCGENIAFPLRETTDLSPEQIQTKVDDFLEAVGIAHAKFLYPDEISGGMQKRLGIARALALNPEIIFYDDPTAGLDPITSKKIIELILDLQRKNKSTVVAITNDVNRAYQLANRMALVIEQELIVTGTPEETKKHPDPRVQQFIRGSLKGPLTEVHS